MSGERQDPISRLRHDLANPLGAIMAEVQLLLMNADRYDEETATGLRQIEALAHRMRDILQQTKVNPQA